MTESAARRASAADHSGLTYAELVGRARDLIPELRERAEETERTRRIPDATECDLHEAGLSRMLQPARFGGAEADFGILIEAGAELAKGCASTSWVVTNLASHHWLLAMFPEQAQRDVWDDSPDHGIASSVVFPAGRARKVKSGYVLTGRWPFSSGVDCSLWNQLGEMVRDPDDADAPSEYRIFLLPDADYEVIDTWTAAGLVLPLIAVHLYVFYFGLMADVTPPVGLASIAASAISRADPIRTGIQAFKYEIRTAILPVVFIFNPELLLIGVTSIWQGVMVFVISLIAILAFSSVTQGWMIVKMKLHEAALLLVVVVVLFRPDFVLDQFLPEFQSLDFERFAASEVFVEPGRKVRFHVVRETDYGNRFKLFVLETPEDEAVSRSGPYGIELAPDDDGRYRVTNLDFNGSAEQAGIAFGDFVTGIDVEQIERPPKEIVYPFGLAILGIVILLQLTRRRRAMAEAL